MKIQTFITYPQIYRDIFMELPVNIESEAFSIDDLDDKNKEKTLKLLRSYFDMCSEEFYLNKRGIIDKKVWKLWDLGIKSSIEKPAFVKY